MSRVDRRRMPMPPAERDVIIVYDDRERSSEEIGSFIGSRRYGDITYRRRKLHEYFAQSLPAWAASNWHHVRETADLVELRQRVETLERDVSFFVISARAGIADHQRLAQLIERLPYAEDSFTDRLYKPLLVFFKNSHLLLDQWDEFVAQSLPLWEKQWKDTERVTTIQALDLGRIRDFLFFVSGATEPRHFNQVQVDSYYYTKRSSDKAKMKAEYSFYGLAPEPIRPWLLQPFGYEENESSASYKMMRHYVSDAALQWVHGAFDLSSFGAFIDRLLFFVTERPRKPCDKKTGTAFAQKLFQEKVAERRDQFLALEEGKRINGLAASADPALAIEAQIERYQKLYDRYGKDFSVDHLVVGHGDPCFSNILYDQQRYLMKLIDPKGATVENDLWTHPLYDVCKISHSVLGDYDFINNGLYDMCLDGANRLYLDIREYRHDPFKDLFRRKLDEQGYDTRCVRLGEASLFLSMLPLHIDHPNKVMAFMLTAKKILDEVEHG